MMRFSLGPVSLDLNPLQNAPRLSALSPSWYENIQKGAHARFDSDVGFYHWVNSSHETPLRAMQETASRLRAHYEGAVLFGIGGSYLGGRTVELALRSAEDEERFPIHWISNVDPAAMARAERFVRHRKCASIIISKSGGTTETLAGFFHLARYLDPHGIIAITDPEKGELRQLAKAQGWTSFPVPPAIGGRFSVLSAVGLFPAYLMGLNGEGLLQGANEMRAKLQGPTGAQNPALLFATLCFLWDQAGRKIQYLMPYRSNLAAIGHWYVQLWGESLGKRNRSGQPVGPTPAAALGTSDQHSLLQLFKEGPHDKIIGFLDVSEKTPELVAQPPFPVPQSGYLCEQSFDKLTRTASQAVERSLHNALTPTYRVELEKVDERTLGALFFFYMTACAYAGECYQVNAFDQPGVEEAKRLWRESL